MGAQPTTAAVNRGLGVISDVDLSKRVVRKAFETFETGDVAAVDTFCHADYRNHEVPGHAGPEGFRAIVAVMRSAFSNLSYDEQRIICQGDTVVLSTVMRGKHTGEFHGLRPTGRVIEQRQTHLVRVRDGKLVEHHAVRDDLRLLVQLGVILIPGDLADDGTVGIPSCALFDAVVRGGQPRVFVQTAGSSGLEDLTIGRIGAAAPTADIPPLTDAMEETP